MAFVLKSSLSLRRSSPSAHIPSATAKTFIKLGTELDEGAKAEKLLRNLAQRLERNWSAVSGAILGRIDEILRHTAWIADAATTLARLYQHRRECDGHGAASLPERESDRARL